MLKHNAGAKVGKGTYWNFSTGERIDISTEGVLPGKGNTAYYRLPATGIIVLGPVLGLLYAAFLPFIGIAMLVKVILQKVATVAMAPTQRAASFGWRPSESYLAGKKKGPEAAKKDEGGESPGDKKS
ncbi:MAG: hypothetical protein M0Z60_15100 [Nitrospiraceae bacterium]|nr:hypothetical protein [Nitrospiraceae bacterium]